MYIYVYIIYSDIQHYIERSPQSISFLASRSGRFNDLSDSASSKMIMNIYYEWVTRTKFLLEVINGSPIYITDSNSLKNGLEPSYYVYVIIYHGFEFVKKRIGTVVLWIRDYISRIRIRYTCVSNNKFLHFISELL